MNTAEMELAVSNYFDYNRNLIVPNTSWGLNMHECDVLVLTPSGYAYEVEIKISKGDLVRDKKKKHGHYNPKLKALYFAIPEELEHCIEHIPERAGILIARNVSHRSGDYRVIEKIRKPIINKNPYRWSDQQRYDLARLGAIRIWNLMRKILDYQQTVSEG